MRFFLVRAMAKNIFVLLVIFSTNVYSQFSEAQEMFVDKFNQSIPLPEHENVTKARELRLENFGEAYDLDRSISILEDVVEKEKNYYRAWFNLALAFDRKNYDAAKVNEAYLTAIDIAQKENIKDGTIYNSAGWANLRRRNYKVAEEFFNTGLEFEQINSDWTNSAIQYNLGRLYFETRDYQKAKLHLTVSLSEYGNPLAENLIELIQDIEN